MSWVNYDKIDEFQKANAAYTPGIRSMGLGVGATNNNLTIANNTMTPTSTPFAGYLIKSLTRLNLDRITFPKIYKPVNTKCQVDVCGAGISALRNNPVGAVLALHFDGDLVDYANNVSAESNTGTFDTTNKKFGTASIAYNGSQFTQYANSENWTVGNGDFVIEFWFKMNAINTNYFFCGQTDNALTPSATSVYVEITSGNNINLKAIVGSTVYQSLTQQVTDTNWHFFRGGRNGTNLFSSIDGVVGGAGTIAALSVNTSTGKFSIGGAGTYATGRFNGKIDEFVFSKGVPMNTSNFSVPTAPYESIQISSQGFSLSGTASATTDFYKDDVVVVTSGTGTGQTRKITAYNGTTKVATLDQPWTTLPTTSSGFLLYDGIVSDISPGFDFSTIDYTVYPTVNVLCSLERLTGATASPSMGVPIVTSIENDWESQAPVLSTNATTTYQTVLNASGRCKLDGIHAVNCTSSQWPVLKVTVDGKVKILDFSFGAFGALAVGKFIPLNLISNSSLLVEHKSSGAQTTEMVVSYSK